MALGISEVTISWGRLIQNRHQVQFSLLHAFWSVFVLLLMIQFWWAFWNFRIIEDWSFAALMGPVLGAIALVLCALLLTPSRSLDPPINLEELYFAHSRPFFLLGAFSTDSIKCQRHVYRWNAFHPHREPRAVPRCIGRADAGVVIQSPSACDLADCQCHTPGCVHAKHVYVLARGLATGRFNQDSRHQSFDASRHSRQRAHLGERKSGATSRVCFPGNTPDASRHCRSQQPLRASSRQSGRHPFCPVRPPTWHTYRL